MGGLHAEDVRKEEDDEWREKAGERAKVKEITAGAVQPYINKPEPFIKGETRNTHKSLIPTMQQINQFLINLLRRLSILILFACFVWGHGCPGVRCLVV